MDNNLIIFFVPQSLFFFHFPLSYVTHHIELLEHIILS